MSWSSSLSGIEKGIAVDPAETASHHQLISHDVDKHGITALHYSVFQAPVGFDYRPRVPTDFVERMCCKTPDDPVEISRLTKLYSDFAQGIRPFGASMAFELGQVADALTYDLFFDEDKNFITMGMRPTRAMMVAHLTPERAQQKAFAERPDPALRVWYDMLAQNHAVLPHFETLTNAVTRMINRQTCDFATENALDLVFRLEPEKEHQIPCYGSVSKASSRATNKLVANDRAFVSATATRKIPDFYNLLAVRHFLVTAAEIGFPEGTALGIANFNRHKKTWQAMRFAA